MAPSPQSLRWVFTLNNYTDEEQADLANLGLNVVYLVYGRETAPATGTPHLQGFVIFRSNKRLNAAKSAICPRRPGHPHLEVARASSAAAAAYCKKANDFEEFGSLPSIPGKNCVYTEFREWVIAQPVKPTERLIANEFPALFARNSRLLKSVDLWYPSPPAIIGDLRPHQLELRTILDGPANDRKIIFIVDIDGGSGKTWFSQFYFSSSPDRTQLLGPGKVTDIAYAIDESKSVFFFDIPRTAVQFFQYPIVESLKDGIIFSAKYESRAKVLLHKPAHVVVMMNEYPNMQALSADRYDLKVWNVN